MRGPGNLRSGGSAAAAALLGLLGCGEGGNVDDGARLTEGALAIQKVEWNPQKLSTGAVVGVAEVYEDLAIFSDRGVQVFTSGALAATDATVTKWKAAALVPAGDLSGDWAVGVASDGRLLRLKNRSALEDVTDRYGLRGTPLTEVAALGEGLVGLAYDKGLAVANGQEVTRYDGSFAGLVGGGGRAATLAAGQVRVFSPKDGGVRAWALPGVIAVAFDPAGHLVAATPQQLYTEVDTALRPVWTPDATIHGLVGTPSGVWVALGDTLALVNGDAVRRAPAGMLAGAAEGRLIGSPVGDVWMLAGGTLTRFAEDDGGGEDKDLWRKSVLPMFSRLCAICHLPGGSAGIDLSTYGAWSSRRALMDLRVVQRKPTPMPPAGAGALTADELAGLKAWIANKQ